MDVSLSSNPQTLTLISCLSPSSSSSPAFSSHRFRSLHTEFLGCGNRLRPPGLRSRKRWRNSGFLMQSPPRFVVRGSLVSQPIVVFVAVAAVSALTVVYFNYTRRKSDGGEGTAPDTEKTNSNDVSEKVKVLNQATEIQTLSLGDTVVDTHCSGVSEEVEVVLKQVTEIQTLNLGDTIANTHTKESNFTSENINASEKREREHKRASSTHMHLVSEESYSSSVAVLTSNNRDLGSTMVLEGILELQTESPDGAELGSDFHGPDDSGLCSKSHDLDGAELGTNSYGPDGSHLASDNHGLVVHPLSNGSIIHVNAEKGETKLDHKPNHAVSQAIDSQIPGYSSLFKESSREELHTFYEQNQDTTRCISNFRNPRSIATRVQRSNSLPSVLRTNAVTSEVSVENFPQSPGSVSLNGHLPFTQYKDGTYSNGKNYKRGGEVPVDIGKAVPQNGQRVRPEFLQTNGRHVDAKYDPQNYLSTYNRLLRDGRLADCLELLESTEQKGVLDMDKIYHAKFFNICKSQKAVKQAFRFAKLIGNPTLSTFNMLLSVCASSRDSEGAFQILHLVKEAGLRADCKLYTTLISTCAKSGKVDTMFKVFHEMVNAGIEPNLHTYGALIDGCARAGQVAKAFGAYGILRSKNVKPDRVVFNALITACGQSGAVDRAFDVLAEMKAEPTPVDPDHVTIGALIRTCTLAGQFDRAREVYKMIQKYKIRGTAEVYTIAVSSCSQMGDLEFALSIYRDMTRNGITPDEMFLSAIIDVAGHAGKVDVAYEILNEAKARGIKLGNITYGSLMGACSNSKNWQKALELHEDIRSIKLPPTVSMLNALVTALCEGDQLQKAVEVLTEMKEAGVSPNIITYSILLVGSEKKDALEIGHMLYSQAKKEGVTPNLIMCKCLIGMCLRRFEKAYSLGEQVLSFKSGKPEVDNEWTSMALTVYRDAIVSGVMPTMEVFSLVLGCLQFPHDVALRVKFVEYLGVSTDASRCSNLNSLMEGFGEYDPRAFALLEEATSHGILQSVSFKQNPIIVDARKMQIHIVEVYLLTILKGLKHRLAAGGRLANINIVLPIEKTQVQIPKQEKTIKLAGRVGQAVGALLRRLGLHYQGSASKGKIRINGISVKRWMQPKLASPFSGKPSELNSTDMRLGKGITDQQRDIRMSNMSLE